MMHTMTESDIVRENDQFPKKFYNAHHGSLGTHEKTRWYPRRPRVVLDAHPISKTSALACFTLS